MSASTGTILHRSHSLDAVASLALVAGYLRASNAGMREAQILSLQIQRPLPWMFGEVALSSSHPQLPIAAVHETAMSIAEACPFVSAIIFIRIFCQVAEVTRFQIVTVHHVISRDNATAFRVGGSAHSPRLATPVAFVAASPTLHA